MSNISEELQKAPAKQEPRPGLIANILVFSMYLFASGINAKYFEALVHYRAVSSRVLNWSALLVNINPRQRLAVMRRGGHLSALLVRKLTCFNSQRCMKRKLKHAFAVSSRMNFFNLKDCAAKCGSILEGHRNSVRAVAIHPFKPFFMTGSDDNTVKFWKLNEDHSNASCVFTLERQEDGVKSVAFHPSGNYFVTGILDGTVKFWKLNDNFTDATCLFMLREHYDGVNSVAFHPSGNYFATASKDKTTKFWKLNDKFTDATCVSTLKGHRDGVNTVLFHPSGLWLATGSQDKKVKMWELSSILSSDGSEVSCVLKLKDPNGIFSSSVRTMAIHPSGKYLATGGNDNTVNLWEINADRRVANFACKLRGHTNSITSVDFHPSGQYLMSGSLDDTAKFWLLKADCSDATCVKTLSKYEGRSSILVVEFYPTNLGNGFFIGRSSISYDKPNSAELWC
jgi:WD40 repeat protein